MSKQLAPVDEVKVSLSRMKDQFKAALPSHIPVDKFVRVLQTAVATTPQLIQAPRASLYSACMKAAQDGLIPDGREAALVSFNTKNGVAVAYMPMVAGILKKVRNSGELSSITSQLIYERDDFEFYVDEDGEHLRHRPNMFSDRGALLGAYALAKTKDGAVYIEVMTLEQINAVKAVSKGKSGPWSGPFEGEMIKKTLIKRLAKRLPMSTDLDHTIHADDDLYEMPSAQQPPPPQMQQQQPARLAELMDAAADSDHEEPVDVTPPPMEENLPI